MALVDQPPQASAPTPEQIAEALDSLHLAVNFHKPYLSVHEAAAYTGRSLKAFYEFALRAGIVRMGDGTIARRDLDRIKRQRWTAKRGPKGRPSPQSHVR